MIDHTKYITIEFNLKIQNLYVIIYKTVLLEDFRCTIVYVRYNEIAFENVWTKLNTRYYTSREYYSRSKDVKECVSI